MLEKKRSTKQHEEHRRDAEYAEEAQRVSKKIPETRFS